MPVRRRVAVAAHRLDSDPRLLAAIEWARSRLPGDAAFGDPLSAAGDSVGGMPPGSRRSPRPGPGVLSGSGSRPPGLPAHAGVVGSGEGEQLAVLYTDGGLLRLDAAGRRRRRGSGRCGGSAPWWRAVVRSPAGREAPRRRADGGLPGSRRRRGRRDRRAGAVEELDPRTGPAAAAGRRAPGAPAAARRRYCSRDVAIAARSTATRPGPVRMSVSSRGEGGRGGGGGGGGEGRPGPVSRTRRA